LKIKIPLVALADHLSDMEGEREREREIEYKFDFLKKVIVG